MDGFDDLLKQSRSALEDNPFEDPFAKPRSNSPDPWSSNYLGSSTAATDDFDSSAAFDTHTTTAATSVVHDDERSTTPTTESQPFSVSGGADPAPAPADPLDLANANLSSDEDEPSKPSVKSPRSYGFRESVEPEHEPPSSSTSSGFRESIEPESEPESQQPKPHPQPNPLLSPLSPAADSSPISPTPTPYSPIATTRRPSTPSTVSITSPVFAPGTSTSTSASDSEPASSPPVSARLPQRQTSRPSATDTLGTPTPTTQTHTRSIISPLEQQQGSLDGSFANLALGGEGFSGGWDDGMGAQSTFVSSPPAPSRPEEEEEEDDDDDKPLRPRPSESESSTRLSASLSSKDKGIQPEFAITVDDPQKVGDPIRGYTMYTVHTRTSSPLFTKPSFSVLRRYSDFLWLYETLSLSNPGVVVPPVPEKNPFGRFDDRFVQQRRIALENCISKIANHPVLGKDADLRFFLESDNFALDIKHRKAELAQEKGGLLANLGQSIAGPRFIENDEWFDRQKGYLDTLEAQLRGLVKAIDVVSKQRTGSDLALHLVNESHHSQLSTSIGEFAQMIADLASSDLGKPLMASLGLLADVERKAQDIESEQAKQDLVTLMGTADEYARLINSVRMAFSSRIRTYHAWQTADTELRRARQNHDRNRAQGRIPTDRMGHSMSQIADAERRALESKNEFEHVSKLVKSEVARFETERIEDFKRSMERFLDGMIDRQKELIAAREQFQHAILQRVSSSSAGQQQTNGSSALRTVA
ncbi:Vps5-domain-containing protein [Stereum hirsutum FP-91666 SS1]|uniref:Vps5-domain-containing protein n=1 Tax=Stereum hirsutum (strain FP-91666) TaxID=721885 RepID=UPI000440F4C6|nr:Vps5-domain-containing protein [Stereum hirsutum FP-91666 SS1]EIM86643.1 Vps5-domain-containing protein [Stereum hirsutum FP-91666 SS1]